MKQEPCCSTSSTSIEENSYNNEKSKQLLNEAFIYCKDLLLMNDLITQEIPFLISIEAKIIGQKIYNYILTILREEELIENKQFIPFIEINKNNLYPTIDTQEEEEEDELIASNETDDNNLYHTIDDDINNNSDNNSDDYNPENDKQTKATEFIPLETKIKIVKLAQEHPRWSLKTLRKKGARKLKRKDELKRWENDIINGGTTFDKYNTIDSLTYDRFVQARANNLKVTTRNLQKWALHAANQYQCETFKFKASKSWAVKFKRKHKIRQRKIIKDLSCNNNNNVTLDYEILPIG